MTDQTQNEQNIQQPEAQEDANQEMTAERAQALLAEHGLTVTRSMTTPKKANKRPKQVWLVRGRLDPFRDLLYELGGSTRFTGRNTFSFWDDPTADIAEGIEEQGEATIGEQVALKDERSEYRADRYNQRAQTKLKQQNQAYNRSNQATEGIPLGQPVLVGHHSEKHHRRALDKSDRAMRESVEAGRKATDLTWKAAGSQAQIDKRQSKSYMENRLREAETKKREAERRLLSYPENRTYQLDLKDAEAAIAHWSAALEEAGVLTQDDVKKGDYVLFISSWYKVVRVNKKSVTIEGWLGVPRFTYLVPYGKIENHKTTEDIKELKAQAEAKAEPEAEEPPTD